VSREAGRRTVAALALAALALSGCVSVGDGGDAGVSAATSTSTTARARATTTSPPRAGAGREPTGAPVTIAFGGDVHFEGAVAENRFTFLGAVLQQGEDQFLLAQAVGAFDLVGIGHLEELADMEGFELR